LKKDKDKNKDKDKDIHMNQLEDNNNYKTAVNLK